MSQRVLSLNCPNCGANLSFNPDLTQFACSYCGAPIAVRLEGGAVSLTKLNQTVERIEVHAERTAAELAIARYEKEIAALETELVSAESPRHMRTGLGCLVSILAILLGFSVATTMSQTAAGVVLVLAGISLGVYAYRTSNSPEADAMKLQIQGLRIKLAMARRAAEGTEPFHS